MKYLNTMLRFITIFILIIVFSPSIHAQKSLNKKNLITIADENVSVAEFMKTFNKNNSNDDLTKDGAIEEYLDLYINFKLKVMEAKALELDTIPTFVNELDGYRKQLAKPYFVDESVNEALLEEAYQRKLKDVRASHILIMVDEKASAADTLKAYNKLTEIRKEILAGKDFAVAALEYSDDPSAKDQKAIPNKQRFRKGNKGDLGYFTVFNMVYPFENAAYNTPVGEISQPIRTRFGYHLLKIDSKTDALGTAQVAHIYVTLRPDASVEDSTRKAEKINNIYAKIEAGMSFEEAVTRFSEDKGSAKNKGQLSKFTCNKVVPEFVDVAKELKPGDVSKPITTLYGFHIVKLISRQVPGTFEVEQEKLKERLAKDDRTHKSEDAVVSKIKKENNFKVYQKQKEEVFANIDDSVLEGTFNADSIIGMTKVLFKIAKEKHLQSEFVEYVVKKQKKQEGMDKEVYLNQMFKNLTESELLKYEDAHLEEHFPEFADLMNEYHDGILLFNLTDEKVWSKAVKDTLGQQEFFASNRKNYMWGERVNATVYRIRKAEDVDKTIEIIMQYDNDGDIAKALDTDSITSVRIMPGKYEKGDDKYIDQVNWTPGLSSPIKSDVENLVVLVKIKEVIPVQNKELKESRGMVTADYQNYLEKQWIEELKAKYPVTTNQEVLNALILKEKSTTTNK
jgi:peptidyl-prolyl cis-trans isomerase SurA